MFKSLTILIISKVTIETITKTTKIVIESIEKEFVTKIATKIAIKSIEKKIVLNEKRSNWKNIFNKIALSIEIKTIETIKTIKATNATNVTKTTIDESTTNSDWDEDSNEDLNSNTKSRNDRESRIDKSRNAEILSLSFFLTWDLRSSLSISLRKKTKIFVSRLSRKIIMFKEKY